MATPFIFDKYLDKPVSQGQTSQNDPAGAAQEAGSDLSRVLARTLRGGNRAGFSSALDLLERRGRGDLRQENLDRRAAEANRQILQQDIAQNAAQAGLTGAAGTGALSAQADIAAADQKARIAEDAVAQEEANRRADLSLILQDLFFGTGLDLGAGRIPAEENETPTGRKLRFQTIGQGLGVFGSLFGAGGGGNTGGA